MTGTQGSTHTPYSVFGSPRNTNHGRKCGCQIKFRPAERTRREDTGYDVYTCAAHGAGPELLAALSDARDILASPITAYDQHTRDVVLAKAQAAIDKAEK